MVIGGLVESFVQELYGEQLLGPWVAPFDMEGLAYSTEVIKKVLHAEGFAEASLIESPGILAGYGLF